MSYDTARSVTVMQSRIDRGQIVPALRPVDGARPAARPPADEADRAEAWDALADTLARLGDKPELRRLTDAERVALAADGEKP